MALAYVGMGSNLGDRLSHLEAGLAGIASVGTVLRGSSIYETAPVGEVEQGPFLNAVIAVETDVVPREVLEALLVVEATRGRRREVRWGPRTLDLDLLTFDDVIIDEPGLSIPHPEIRHRRFVLAPLVEIAPDLADANGRYADGLTQVLNQPIHCVTGPLKLPANRWPPIGA